MASSYLAETIEGNEHLLSEILIRVPAIPLLRFQCVSKRWHSLISSRYFRHHHTLRHTATTKVSGMFMQPEPSYNSTKFNLFSLDGKTRRRRRGYPHRNHPPPPPSFSHFNSLPLFNIYDPQDITIWQSCNGLILGSIKETTPNYLETYFFVMNPTTKDFNLIPYPNWSQLVRVGLAFDPLISPNYTLICVWICAMDIDLPVTEDPEMRLYKAMVYSSESRTWNPSCDEPIVASLDTSTDRGVYYDGAVHWIFASRKRLCSCFDVKGKRMREDLMPPLPALAECYYFVTPAYGRLNLVGIGYLDIHVFQLKRDYSAWDPIHTVRIADTQLPTAFPGMVNFVDRRNNPNYNNPRIMFMNDGINCYYQCRVLELLEYDAIMAAKEGGGGGGGGGGGDVALLLQLGGTVVALRLKDKTMHEGFELESELISTYLFLSSEPLWLRNSYKAYAYIPSLASV